MFWTRIGAILTAILFATTVNAATVKEIRLDLGFLGTTYFDASVYDVSGCTPSDDLGDCGQVLFDGSDTFLSQADDVWGLPRILPFTPGQRVSFTARLNVPDPGTTETGSVDSCQLGGIDCRSATQVQADDSSFSLLYGVSAVLGGNLTPGSSVFFREDSLPLGAGPFAQTTTSGDLAIWRLWQGNFTVLEPSLPPVSAVPLPASVLLLPLGLAALGSQRRKRRAPQPGGWTAGTRHPRPRRS